MGEAVRSDADVTARPPAQSNRVSPTNPFVRFTAEEVEQSIADRFEQQVARFPDRLAVKTRDHELTYEALNKAANRVARAVLAERGEGKQPVALLFDAGASFVIGTIGVLKAGTFCTPIDPTSARATGAYVLDDSQAELLITDDTHLSLAFELAAGERHVVNVDDLDPGLSQENLGLSIRPDAIALLPYTSGSTGQPKGVIRNHRNVLHRVMNHTNGWHISTEDRLSLVRSSSVAPAVTSIFSALLNGASVHPLNLREEGIAHVADWLVSEQITIYHSSVSVFRQFVETLTGVEKFPQLRLIKLSSESAYKSDVELFKRYFSSNCLLAHGLSGNEHGMVCENFIDKDTPITDNVVPLGYPVDGFEVLLLDESGERVGFNTIGEIVIKSRYLSPGYWRRPDLTQAAFLPDPSGGDEHIYPTGDLGR